VSTNFPGLWTLGYDAENGSGRTARGCSGTLSIADVMYAPVASRFKSSRIPLADSEMAYRDAVLGLPAMQEWIAAANAETERISKFDE
jgi:glutathione S-transferase